MNFKIILIFILAAQLLVSCGGKQADTTEATIAIGFGSIGNSHLVDGGVMIYGWKHDQTERFGFKYNDQIVELSNGGWEFVAIAWDDTALSGDLRCSHLTNVQLEGGSVEIAFTLNQTNCTGGAFGSDDVRDSTTGVPYNLSFKTCANESCVYGFNDDYNPALRGVAQSFKVLLAGQDESGNPTVENGVLGPCEVHTADTIEITSSTTKLPILNLPIATAIRAYDSNDCSGGYDEYLFYNGVRGHLGNTYFFPDPDNTKNVISLKSDLCRSEDTPSNIASNFRYSASDGSYHVICNGSHFAAISTDLSNTGHQDATYILGGNIDLTGQSGGSFSPIGSAIDFMGILEGNGYTLSNFTATDSTNASASGIFATVKGTASNYAVIKNLNLENIHLTNNVDNVSSFGILVGSLEDYTQIYNVSGNNLSITVDTCTSGCSSIGGLIGTATPGTSTYAETYGVNLENVTIHANAPSSEVGGIIGFMTGAGSSSLRTSKINNVTFNHPTYNAGATSFGGAVGNLQGEIWDVSAVVDMDNSSGVAFDVANAVGGLVGTISSTSGRIYFGSASGTIELPQADQVGGVIGSIVATSDIQDLVSSVTLNIDSTSNGDKVGGVIGDLNPTNNASLFRLRNFGDINDCSDYCGGIIGNFDVAANSVELFQAHNYGGVYAAGNYSGGVVGYYATSSGGTKIHYSHNEGNVNGNSYVGGVIGYRNSGDGTGLVQYVYNTGNVAGTTGQIAGIIGDVGTFSDGNIKELYNTGTVSGGLQEGAFSNQTDGGSPPVSGAGNVACYILNGQTDTSSLCSQLTAAGENSFANYGDLDTNEWQENTGTGTPQLSSWAPVQTLGDSTLGSKNDPFIIDSTTKWNVIEDNPQLMRKSFQLGANLDFGNTQGNFHPIASTANPFLGNFSGNNYTISNILHNDSGEAEPLGLFRVIGSDGSYNGARIEQFDDDYDSPIKKLYLENIDFTSDDHTSSYLGALAGKVYDAGTEDYKAIRISNVEVLSGTLNIGGGNSPAVGGVIGYLDYSNTSTEIRDIYSAITISSCPAQSAGGIIGQAVDTVPLSAESFEIEMLNFAGSINCTSTNYVGGIIGLTAYSSMVVAYSQNSGSIDGGNYVGGLVGSLNGYIHTSFNKGNVSGTDEIGGLVGHQAGEVKASYTEGTVDATGASGTAGGISGNCNTCNVENSLSNATVTASGGGTANTFIITPSAVSNSYYVDASDLTITGATQIATTDDLYDPSNFGNLSSGLGADDPWVHFPGDAPRFHFEIFPEMFEH